MKYQFHLDKFFSNPDTYGNVYSFLKITDNHSGETLYASDQGKNGSHIMHKYFNDYGHWSESEIWEKIRDYNRLEKFHKVQHLRVEQIHAWLSTHSPVSFTGTETPPNTYVKAIDDPTQ